MNAQTLSDEERLARLRLIRSERIGPRSFAGLVARFGGAAPALDALPTLARQAGRGDIAVCSRGDALREIDQAHRLGARFVALGEADYPAPLAASEGAPPLICVRGDVAVLHRPIAAIVGSRNASAVGGAFAERLAAGLGEAGFVIVSGLARGIDTRAHRAALPTGTVAVLAGGLHRIYPAENAKLLESIVERGGAALSEMPIGWEARGRDFPRRNRIVSGLAYGVVVVEAARRSGSLITARFAAEQGREVLAVPGSPLDPRAEGTNDLIRNGATLCTSPEDVVSALAPLVGRLSPPGLSQESDSRYGEPDDPLWDEWEGGTDDPRPLDPEPPEEAGDDRRRVERLLGVTPVGIDELARQAGLSVRSVQTILVELELAGRLGRHGGGNVSLLPPMR